MKRWMIQIRLLILVGSTLMSSCGREGDLQIVREVEGPLNTNCYLIWDSVSRQAALIDAGGPVDSLCSVIEEHNLRLQFILLTHGHWDHVEGVPALKKKFTRARLCFTQEEYNAMHVYNEWGEKNSDRSVLPGLMEDPATAKMLNFDMASVGKPDITLRDGDCLMLGRLSIHVMHTPGHSRGSVCYRVDNALFSGDCLFCNFVGRTDYYGGSSEDQLRSVKRLYSECPDSMRVYPGHGRYTYIGAEKKENLHIRENTMVL